jgi:mannose-6-phosphate isomerase-like protein (cupin superfamily)
MTGTRLEIHPIHLGNGGTAVPQPEFPRDARAMEWYVDYGARHTEDGADGRLLSCFRFTEDWAGWEMHPAGAEVVVCIDGAMTLIQDIDGEHVRTTLAPGEYAINPAGVWHTADVDDHATGFFVTPGVGTQGRPR